jgi:molybdopterin molybdotransferase
VSTPRAAGEHSRAAAFAETRLEVAVAVERVTTAIAPLAGSEDVPLAEALGRVLAADVVAPVSLPPWDNSAMDGYAVRAADVRDASPGTPVRLPVVATIGAGHRAPRALATGEAMRIMTGAPLPDGADTVVRVEDTDGGEQVVDVRDARDTRAPTRNVRPRAEDLRAGSVALAAGAAIGPAHLGVLAACGQRLVRVRRRPRVAIVATGDEIVDLDRWDDVVAGERIPSTNSWTLHALVRQAGGEPVPLGIAPDEPVALRDCLERAKDCDLLLTTGGVSVGAFDHVRPVLAAMGAELRFWRARMRPGAPLGFGLVPRAEGARGALPWLGLPGNPVSAMVTFELFARPAIRRLAGHAALFRRPVPVVLEDEVRIAAPLTHFMRVTLHERADGRLGARLTGPQGSGLLTSMARADALLVLADDAEVTPAGSVRHALPLGDDWLPAMRFAL